jgi:hypothetical protein
MVKVGVWPRPMSLLVNGDDVAVAAGLASVRDLAAISEKCASTEVDGKIVASASKTKFGTPEWNSKHRLSLGCSRVPIHAGQYGRL